VAFFVFHITINNIVITQSNLKRRWYIPDSSGEGDGVVGVHLTIDNIL
jgi:uncharacterized protein affecting Mg2+/Co2+ transport